MERNPVSFEADPKAGRRRVLVPSGHPGRLFPGIRGDDKCLIPGIKHLSFSFFNRGDLVTVRELG